ncbi:MULTISPECIES: DMT family transporter [Bacillota]|jgi:drug/metabolite transporter (DMT)-like permease|uniref:EamA family transporter n=2 Tax=Amedibacillus TaxID=2749846 RepID=A0A7G9GNT7_9FIRM|nr:MULTISPECIES: DMT family transporter [Bacillota]QNM12469.1 EamA family transporter [[Eubacterium] hominis]MCH4284224.1 DMT family transporter [Amedibacillus hominis]RGB57525.1 EamA/RhaT family transporter [Absiella sp. AM22-9]RGB62368.1 EamA/RhaT family transporter [Absiella sp. AM10-20]RHU07283.1 EamA/RhaT family transporter [Absiella sp. AM27-20]
MVEMKKYLSKGPVVLLLAAICCFLWGSATPSIKTGYALLQINAQDTPSILLFAGIRFMLAGVMVLLLQMILTKRCIQFKRGSGKRIAILALFQTIGQYFFFYVGLAHTSGVKGAIITGMNVFLAILVSSFIFHFEKLSKRKMIGCCLGFAGIVIINITPGAQLDASFSIMGEGFVLLAQVAYALSSGFIKKFGNEDDPVMLSGGQFFVGGIVLAGIGFVMGGQICFGNLSSYLITLYLAFISAVAYTLWGILLKYNPVSKVSIYGFMNPLFGVLLSAIILQEGSQAFSLQGIMALLLVVIGIMVVNLKGKNQKYQKN